MPPLTPPGPLEPEDEELEEDPPLTMLDDPSDDDPPAEGEPPVADDEPEVPLGSALEAPPEPDVAVVAAELWAVLSAAAYESAPVAANAPAASQAVSDDTRLRPCSRRSKRYWE